MYTFTYKGWYIHDNFTDNVITVQDLDYNIYKVNTVIGAKRLITKLQSQRSK